MNVTDFILVRHGETDENLKGIMQGQADTLLNETGLKQAHCVAERLRGERFDRFYSSDLIRAMTTAAVIRDAIRLSPTPLSSLREWDFGIWQGHTVSEFQAQREQAMRLIRFDPDCDVPIEGGESRREFSERVSDCMDILAERHAGERVLIVTHAGVLRAVYQYASGRLERPPKTGNACICHVQYDAGTGLWKVLEWNDVNHLKSLAGHETEGV